MVRSQGQKLLQRARCAHLPNPWIQSIRNLFGLQNADLIRGHIQEHIPLFDHISFTSERGIHVLDLVRQSIDLDPNWPINDIDRMGLEINRDKIRIVDLRQTGEGLDFLGFTFRFDKDLYGGSRRYLNLFPSKKSLAKERDTLRR